jgi:opacity protein-like surface antigen
LGTGVEHALSRNVSVGVEYDYFRLEGDASTCVQGVSVFSCSPPGLPLKYADITSDIHRVVLRLNYKFGRDDDYRPLK